MLDPVSPAGESIRDLLIIVTVIGAIVLAIVAGLVTFFALRYRGRPGAADPPPTFGNSRVEAVWFIVPLGIVLVLFVLSVRVARDADPSTEGHEPDLIVVGHQWWWEVVYTASGAVTANEIHIPTGTRLLMQLESIDVIHDFWVPEIGPKRDAIPGKPNRLWIEASRPGTYLGACAEFCGTQHAWMRLRVIAQPPDEFDAWLRQQAAPHPQPSGADAMRGQQLFMGRTCASCHAVDGTVRETRPGVGPNLAHLATRETLGAGVLDNSPENLTRWLKNPQAYKPGSLMPNLNLTDEEVAALVAYLEGQP
jgi:cytochrome c oxidase subunit 2